MKKARLRVDEAAALLDVHTSTMRRWIEEHTLPALHMPGGQQRIRIGELTKLLRHGFGSLTIKAYDHQITMLEAR